MYCESCGRSIPENATQCPSCSGASDVRAIPAGTGSTAAAARMARVPTPTKQTALTKAEQTIFFRIARGFSWLLLVVVSIATIFAGAQLVPVLTQFFGTSTRVAATDLTATNSPLGSEDGEGEMTPAQMAQLDQASYEVIQLLPPEARQNQGQVDLMRGQIKGAASNLAKDRKEQMAILQELRDDLKQVNTAERSNALQRYFLLKGNRLQQDRATKEAAQVKLLALGGSMISGIGLLTLITMILVLLSIERNTRFAA
jgi:hypothetical protein